LRDPQQPGPERKPLCRSFCRRVFCVCRHVRRERNPFSQPSTRPLILVPAGVNEKHNLEEQRGPRAVLAQGLIPINGFFRSFVHRPVLLSEKCPGCAANRTGLAKSPDWRKGGIPIWSFRGDSGTDHRTRIARFAATPRSKLCLAGMCYKQATLKL
jgi:hypothetical protein